MKPVVYIVYHHRPMCVGLFFRMAFQQAGCLTYSFGPTTEEVYGLEWPGGETIASDVVLDGQRAYDVDEVVGLGQAQGLPPPDLVVGMDQYDFIYLTGSALGKPWKGAYIAVENWNPEQASRWSQRQGFDEYHMIAHVSGSAPLPPTSEFMAFGADPFVHPLLGLKRDIYVCQIGTEYEPRPTNWNTLRAAFDSAPPCGAETYKRSLQETAHTIFGKTPTYTAMAKAYNRSMTAISASNCDFLPMRAPEAFAMGSVLLSDDQPIIRKTFGAPWPEDPAGCWVAHDTTAQDILEKVWMMVDDVNARIGIQIRALAMVAAGHWYYHRAMHVLQRAGIQTVGRMIVSGGGR